MKKVTLDLSKEQAASLATLEKRLVKAIERYSSASAGIAKLAEKFESLAAEVAELETGIDPLDDAAMQSLAAKKGQLALIAQRIENPATGDVPAEVIQEIKSLSRISGEAVSDVMRGLYRDTLEYVAQAVRPFYDTPERAALAAPECTLMWELRYFLNLGFGISGAPLGEAQLALKYLQMLLRGESPYRFPPVKDIPELAIFAK